MRSSRHLYEGIVCSIMAKGKGRSQEYDNIHEAKEKLRDEPRGTDLKEASSVNVQPENDTHV